MGTEISLSLCGLDVDWSKNSMGVDHGCLFQEGDRRRLRSDQLDYDYFAENPDELAANEMALARPLKLVLPRLAMLGHTLESTEGAYAAAVTAAKEHAVFLAENGYPRNDAEPMSFREFCAFVAAHPVKDLDDTYIESDPGRSDRVRGRFIDDAVLSRIPNTARDDGGSYSERSFYRNLIGFLDPYSLLWVLGQNAENLETDVAWQYGPLVENGWESADSFATGARRRQTFLIATEGSSDAHILTHALKLFRPEIADFFRFIDVSERHPFSGTGSLLKFAEGLVKIDVQNQIVFVFDNDAEGCDAFQKMSGFRLPPNMGAMLLPDVEEFRSFPAHGPEGLVASDINGRAAAIECYLDLTFGGRSPARVIWTNYKSESGTYQGSLEHKETYMRDFLKQTPQSVAEKAYDVRKMQAVLDALVGKCQALAGLD